MSEEMDAEEAKDTAPTLDRSSGNIADYIRLVESGKASSALAQLLTALAEAPEQDWLNCSRVLVLRGDTTAATRLLAAADLAHPEAADISLALAGMYYQTGRQDEARPLLNELLRRVPGHAAAALLLMHILKDAGRTREVAEAAHAWFQQGTHDLADLFQVIELLDECDRKEDAAALCEREIAAGSGDSRIHAYAGTLLTQLGQFDLARDRYLFALARDERAFEWNVATGLATLQRYRDGDHPDFALFEAGLLRQDLSDRTRASLLFALGKACDDTAQYAKAAQHFISANALCRSTIQWSRKLWRRGIDARLGRTSFSVPSRKSPDWTPIFIVGMPRSGTTLLAELLSRHPDVSNRGELIEMQRLEQQFSQTSGRNPAWHAAAAAAYETRLRSDDSTASWYIDKQPHNFMCVDMILAIFPNAKIIHCQRNARDNALSLWSQFFLPDAQNFSYDLADVAVVLQGCKRLMAHWQKRYGQSIQAVRYEQLVTDPTEVVRSLMAWLGMPMTNLSDSAPRLGSISSASLWQARQPVHSRSIDRWQHYAKHLPELLRIPANL